MKTPEYKTRVLGRRTFDNMIIHYERQDKELFQLRPTWFDVMDYQERWIEGRPIGEEKMETLFDRIDHLISDKSIETMWKYSPSGINITKEMQRVQTLSHASSEYQIEILELEEQKVIVTVKARIDGKYAENERCQSAYEIENNAWDFVRILEHFDKSVQFFHSINRTTKPTLKILYNNLM